jgi:hypothetical protein
MLEVGIDQQKIQIGQRFAVSFQRTLRIPDDGQTYPLPPGLGVFPLFKVADYLDRAADLRTSLDPGLNPGLNSGQAEAFFPMYQREAMWLGFSAASWKPNAVKISVGGINAISGGSDDNVLRADPQNYIVCPTQPWLDGVHTGQGSIRQFVAMPLGQGYTVEAAITGAEAIGGIQIVVFEPKPGKFPDRPPVESVGSAPRSRMFKSGMGQMGLGAGGAIQQKIYPDPYGLDTWDQGNYGRIFIHIINSLQFQKITEIAPPATPIDAKTYTEYGLPWFDLYDEPKGDLTPPESLQQVKTIFDRDLEQNKAIEREASLEISEEQIKTLPKGGF